MRFAHVGLGLGLLATALSTGCGFDATRAAHAKEAEAENAKFRACLAEPLACEEACKEDPVACYRFKDERVQAKLAEAQEHADGEHAQETVLAVLTKASEVRHLAEKALATDGTDVARRVAGTVAACTGTLPQCAVEAEQSVATSPVGARAGLALLLVRRVRPSSPSALLLELAPEVERAFREATAAVEKASEIRATRDQRDMQAVAELRPLDDAKEECQKSEPSCRSKCAKDGLYCAALAWVIAETPSRLGEAAAIARDACEDGQGSPSACWTSARLEEDRGKREDRIQKLWNEVAPPAEQIALIERRLSALQARRPSPAISRRIAETQAVIREVRDERYCPAKRAFLAVATEAELLSKAALSCGDEVAPAGAGGRRPLTSCQSIFIRTCGS